MFHSSKSNSLDFHSFLLSIIRSFISYPSSTNLFFSYHVRFRLFSMSWFNLIFLLSLSLSLSMFHGFGVRKGLTMYLHAVEYPIFSFCYFCSTPTMFYQRSHRHSANRLVVADTQTRSDLSQSFLSIIFSPWGYHY